MRPTRRQTVSLLNAGRAAIGLVAWLAPNATLRLFGADPAQQPSAAFVMRLFGARDLVLGVATLWADDEQLDRWLAVGAACDAADALAAVTAAGRLQIPRSRALAMAMSAALSAGVALAVRDR